jgi:hypothetical protein
MAKLCGFVNTVNQLRLSLAASSDLTTQNFASGKSERLAIWSSRLSQACIAATTLST